MEKSKKEYTNVPKTTEAVVSELDRTQTFIIVNVGEKWRIGIHGRWMTKEIFNTKEEAQAYIDKKPWDLIMNLAGAVADFVIWNEKQQNKQ